VLTPIPMPSEMTMTAARNGIRAIVRAHAALAPRVRSRNHWLSLTRCPSTSCRPSGSDIPGQRAVVPQRGLECNGRVIGPVFFRSNVGWPPTNLLRCPYRRAARERPVTFLPSCFSPAPSWWRRADRPPPTSTSDLKVRRVGLLVLLAMGEPAADRAVNAIVVTRAVKIVMVGVLFLSAREAPPRSLSLGARHAALPRRLARAALRPPCIVENQFDSVRPPCPRRAMAPTTMARVVSRTMTRVRVRMESKPMKVLLNGL
jgi:hypothetical protein